MSSVAVENTRLTRDQLLGLAARGESYSFLSLALPVLPQLGHDSQLLLQIIRHYASLGLIRPALDLIEALPAEVQGELSSAGVCAQLARLPDGRLSWERRRERFEANRRVLLARRPMLSETIEAGLRGLSTLELHEARDGNYQICVFDDRGGRVWLPRLMDHKGASDKLAIPQDPHSLLAAPTLIEGLNFGWFLPRLLNATRNLYLNYSSAVYLLEPNPLVLAAVLHLHDWRELLSDERLYLFVGPDAAEQFGHQMLAREDLGIPLHQIRMLSWGGGAIGHAEPVVARIQQHRIERVDTLTREVESIYRERDTAWWAQRYAAAGQRDRLRVFLPVSRHTTYLKYCIRDLAAAFERRGLTAQVVMEPTDHSTTSAITYLELMRDFQPDLVMIIDHFRHEYGRTIPPNLPFVGWIQDQLPNLYSRQCGEALGSTDYFIAPDPSIFVHQYGYPERQGFAWTVATDDRTYSDAPLPAEKLAPFRCDFSYVSNQSTPPECFHQQWRERCAGDAHTAALIDKLYGELTDAFGSAPEQARLSVQWLLERIEDRDGPLALPNESRQALVRFYLDPLAELMFRQSTLEWVAEYCDRTGRKMSLYGRGWEAHPRFSKYARGSADNGQQLRAIYQASAINLQIIGTGAVHQRLLDGLAAGGFFLIRRTPPDIARTEVERYLSAWRTCGRPSDSGLRADQVPELFDAARALHALMGHDLRPERFSIDGGMTSLCEEIEAGGYRRVAGAVFEEYPHLAFSTAEEFNARAERFLEDSAARGRIAQAMRGVVVDRYSYGSLVDGLLAFIRSRLAEQAGTDPHVNEEAAHVLS